MKDRMHHQMASDIKQGLRIDTVIFILTVVFNLFFMGVNSAVSSAVRGYEYTLMGGIGAEQHRPRYPDDTDNPDAAGYCHQFLRYTHTDARQGKARQADGRPDGDVP